MIPFRFFSHIRKAHSSSIRHQSYGTGNGHGKKIDSNDVEIKYTLKEKFDEISANLKDIPEIKVQFGQMKIFMGILVGVVSAVSAAYAREMYFAKPKLEK